MSLQLVLSAKKYYLCVHTIDPSNQHHSPEHRDSTACAVTRTT